jgi:diguanylate cyclase (GGDEF)-like protein
MTGLGQALWILDPIAVLSVSAVLSCLSAVMLSIHGLSLLEFRKPLALMSAAMWCATVSLIGAVVLFDDLTIKRMIASTLPGTISYLLASSSFIFLTRRRFPHRMAAVLVVAAIAGFVVFPQAVESRYWNILCQFVLGLLVCGFALTSQDHEAPKLRWLIVASGVASTLSVLPSLPTALSALAAPGTIAAPIDGPAFRVRVLVWAILPALMYAIVMAIINGRLSNRLQLAVRTDPLTGVSNRRHLYSEARRLLGSHGSHGAVLMIDIDHFKSINDRYGHLVGDRVLRETAQVIQRSVRRYDSVVSRFGGEEFCVVLAHVGQQQAIEVAQRIRKSVALAGIDHDGQAIMVTVSMGVAMNEAGLGLDAVLGQADQRMYAAKTGGRNRVMGPQGAFAHG